MFSSSIISASKVTICISNDHSVYILGKISRYISNINNNNDNTHIPILIKKSCNIKMIDCSAYHVLYLDFDGSVFSFGENYQGQLGLGKNYNKFSKVYIPQKIDIPLCKQIACGSFFSICLTEDNLLYSFGGNITGQLGLNTNQNETYNSPQLIPNLHNIEYIVCGEFHSICKTYDNTYYGWGCNFYSQLGHDECRTYYKPTRCANYPDNIISIKCANTYTLLLTLEGNVYSFGNNDSRNLGFNDIEQINTPTLIRNIPEIRRIECGYCHFMCIDVNNDLWLFGKNDYGQLGLGDEKNRYTPIKHPTLSNIMDISSRGDSTFIKTLDHKIYAFGNNEYSQLGIQTSKKSQSTPIQVFQENDDIWCSFIGKRKQKSARK